MDTTETYIKMCDCPEIQSQWKPAEGDCCVERKYLDFPLHLLDNLGGWGFITATGRQEDDEFGQEISIWLPYQDQLQKMVVEYPKDEPWVTFTSLRDFVMTLPNTRSVYTEQFISWEQLWLAFVMKEKHNKTWSGTEWV